MMMLGEAVPDSEITQGVAEAQARMLIKQQEVDAIELKCWI